MSEHFALDIDPEGLRSVAARVGELREHLRTRGRRTRGTPGEIGDAWTGRAADRVKDEMSGLGGLMVRFGGDLQPVIEGLRTLARDYEDALDRLPELNRRWRAAETAYDDAVRIADNRMDRTRESLQENGTTINRAIMDELETARYNAVSDAAATRRTEQRNLEADFGYLKMWLRQQTWNLSKELSGAVPVPVGEDQLERWRNGEAAGLDFSGVFSRLGLTRDRADMLAEQEERQLRESAREEVRADITDLQKALEDDDAQRIQQYLDLIGGKVVEPPYYAEELVRELGPDGVNELYAQIEGLVAGGTWVTEEIWPHFDGVNDAIARGLESLRPQDFAEFLTEFTDAEASSDRLALLAASTHAGGQVAAATMAYYSTAYTGNHGALGPTFYPEVYHYAYGDDVGRQLELWDEKATGADLAGFFQHMSEKDRQELLDHLLVFAGPEVSHIGEDGWERLGQLYGEGLSALRDQGNAELADGHANYPSEAVQTMLEYVWSRSNSWESDSYRAHVEDVVSDPGFLTWYIRDVLNQGASPAALNEAIEFADGNADELMERIVEHQVSTGLSAQEVARTIGFMLRTEELLGAEIQLGGVLKSLAESVVSGTVKHPVAAPVMGVFDALLEEYQEHQADIQAWEAAMGDNEIHNKLGFALYIEIHGVPPEFTRWVEENGRQDEDAMVDFLQEQQSPGGNAPPTDLYDKINELVELIDESRDEE